MTIPSPQAKVFRYEKPKLTRPKKVEVLARTDIMHAAVQIVREGGENNLHTHEHLDGVWFVLAGRARFYTDDDVVVADLGPKEGVLIPRHFRYWFESSGDEELEILQFEASDRSFSSHKELLDDRIDYTPRNPNTLPDPVEVAAHG